MMMKKITLLLLRKVGDLFSFTSKVILVFPRCLHLTGLEGFKMTLRKTGKMPANHISHVRTPYLLLLGLHQVHEIHDLKCRWCFLCFELTDILGEHPRNFARITKNDALAKTTPAKCGNFGSLSKSSGL